MVLDVSRTRVLAYRAAAQGLDRAVGDPAKLGVLDLGVQNSAAETARLALAARLPELPDGDADPFADDGVFTLLWSFRGAPYLHRRADLAGLASALWPRGDSDAASRLAAERKPLAAAGIPPLEAFQAAAETLRAVVTKPMPKGDVSAAISRRLPDAYSYDCRSCKARHVYGGLFQLVGLPAGIRHQFDTSPPILAPLEGRPAIPKSPAGTSEVVRAYLRLHGPATVTEAAGYLGTTRSEVKPSWPDGLTEVRVDGRRGFLPDEDVAALRNAEQPDYARLLPPLDPFLQSRDRDVLVPDPARQKEIWKILANPGVVFLRGEIAGTWRARASGKKRLTVTVHGFGKLTKTARAQIEEEAERVAAARRIADASMVFAQD